MLTLRDCDAASGGHPLVQLWRIHPGLLDHCPHAPHILGLSLPACVVCETGKMRAASMWAWQCTDACVHVQIAYGIFAGLLSFIVINMGSAIIGLPSQSCAKQGDRDRSKGWETRGKERTKKSLLRAETVTAWGCDDHFVLICTQRQTPCWVRNTRCGTSGRTTTTAAIPGASGVLLSKRRLKCAPLRRSRRCRCQ